MSNLDEMAKLLGLEPHPEGGAFREAHRSPMMVTHPAHGGSRAAGTAIYFLLRAGEFSSFHSVCSEETWHLYDGGPLELHLLDREGNHIIDELGMDLAAGQRPQITIPAGFLQAAIPMEGATHALCGCTVYPGFDFADFSMPTREVLLDKYPQHADLVRRLTRS